MQSTICRINSEIISKECDLSEILNDVLSCENITDYFKEQTSDKLYKMLGGLINGTATSKLLNIIIETKAIPAFFDASAYSTIKNKNILICPRCGSTAITTGARGVNWTWGLIGASKTVNRCGNCGYTWKP